MEDDLVEIEVEIVSINDLSITVRDGRVRTTLPKSQIEEKEPYDFKVGDIVELTIPEWLAEDRDLI